MWTCVIEWIHYCTRQNTCKHVKKMTITSLLIFVVFDIRQTRFLTFDINWLKVSFSIIVVLYYCCSLLLLFSIIVVLYYCCSLLLLFSIIVLYYCCSLLLLFSLLLLSIIVVLYYCCSLLLLFSIIVVLYYCCWNVSYILWCIAKVDVNKLHRVWEKNA